MGEGSGVKASGPGSELIGPETGTRACEENSRSEKGDVGLSLEP